MYSVQEQDYRESITIYFYINDKYDRVRSRDSLVRKGGGLESLW